MFYAGLHFIHQIFSELQGEGHTLVKKERQTDRHGERNGIRNRIQQAQPLSSPRETQSLLKGEETQTEEIN